VYLALVFLYRSGGWLPAEILGDLKPSNSDVVSFKNTGPLLMGPASNYRKEESATWNPKSVEPSSVTTRVVSTTIHCWIAS